MNASKTQRGNRGNQYGTNHKEEEEAHTETALDFTFVYHYLFCSLSLLSLSLLLTQSLSNIFSYYLFSSVQVHLL